MQGASQLSALKETSAYAQRRDMCSWASAQAAARQSQDLVSEQGLLGCSCPSPYLAVNPP